MSFSFLVSPSDTALIGLEALDIIRSAYATYLPGHSYTIELSCASEAEIQELNKQYRDIDEPTDVLSFPTFLNNEEILVVPSDIPILIGSIILCPSKAKSYHETLPQLTHHGLLHLLGFDHEEDFQKWSIEETLVLNFLAQQGLIIPPVTQ